MNYKFKKKPYAHQLTALEKSWNRDNFAYFMEMGTGKTKVLIDNLSMLYDKGKVDGALVIAPKGVVGTWYNQELPNHLPDHIENVTVLWQANINKKQQSKLDRLFDLKSIPPNNQCSWKWSGSGWEVMWKACSMETSVLRRLRSNHFLKSHSGKPHFLD